MFQIFDLKNKFYDSLQKKYKRMMDRLKSLRDQPFPLLLDSQSFLPEFCCLVADKSLAQNVDEEIYLIVNSSRTLDNLEFNARITFTISLRMDKLIGDWIHINQFFQVPDNCQVLASLFIQPIDSIADFAIYIQTPSQILRTIPAASNVKYSTLDTLWGYLSIGANYRPKGQFFETYIYQQFPFVFLQIRGSECYLDSSQITCQTKRGGSKMDIPFDLVPTRDPDIYLLIVSNVIKKEKHCAKLFRHFFKHPDDTLYRSVQPLQLLIGSSVNLEIGHITPHIANNVHLKQRLQRGPPQSVAEHDQTFYDLLDADYPQVILDYARKQRELFQQLDLSGFDWTKL